MAEPARAPSPLRVLVVDDSADTAESAAQFLRLHGHDARVARSAAEALALLDGFTPDAALLDLAMPGVGGFELAARLAAALPCRPLLVAVTGHAHLADRVREAGFDHYLLKPADPDAVAALLTRHARRTGR